MKILGTANGGTNTLTVSGDWTSTAGTFNEDTSTVVMTGSNKNLTTGGTGRYFYNLTIDSGATITDQSGANVRGGGTLTVTGNLTIASGKIFGVLTPASNLVVNPTGALTVTGKFFMYTDDTRAAHITNNGTIGGTGDFYWRLNAGAESTAAPVTATDYGGLRVSFATHSGAGGGGTAVLGPPAATLTTTGILDLYDSWDGGLAINLDNSVNNLAVNVGHLNVGNNALGDGKLIAGSAAYSVTGNVVIDQATSSDIDACHFQCRRRLGLSERHFHLRHLDGQSHRHRKSQDGGDAVHAPFLQPHRGRQHQDYDSAVSYGDGEYPDLRHRHGHRRL